MTVKKFLKNLLIFLLCVVVLLAGAAFILYKKYLIPQTYEETIRVQVKVIEGSVGFYENVGNEKKFVRLVNAGESFTFEKKVLRVKGLPALEPLIPAFTARYTAKLNELASRYKREEYNYTISNDQFYDKYLEKIEDATPLRGISARFDNEGISGHAVLDLGIYKPMISGRVRAFVTDPIAGVVQIEIPALKVGPLTLDERYRKSLATTFNEALARSKPKMTIHSITYSPNSVNVVFRNKK